MKYITKQKGTTVELNPFIVNKPIECVAIPKNKYLDNSEDTTTATRKDLLNSHYLQDRQDKINIYRYGKHTMYEIMFGKLTDKSRSLFLYIMYSLNKNEDYILLSAQKVRQDIGMSNRTLTEALKELKACSVITLKERSIYWVNPMYIFNGNRINYYKSLNEDNVIIKAIL